MTKGTLQKQSLRLANLHKQCFRHLPPPYSAHSFHEFLQNETYYLAEEKYKGKTSCWKAQSKENKSNSASYEKLPEWF